VVKVLKETLFQRCLTFIINDWQEGKLDTDELTEMAYETIMRAVDVLDVLGSEIGAFASDKETEDDFLRGAATQLRRIFKSPKPYLDYWNYLQEVNIKIFRKDVAELLAYVEKVLTIPYGQRGEPAFK
jgi:hypothetical protein